MFVVVVVGFLGVLALGIARVVLVGGVFRWGLSARCLVILMSCVGVIVLWRVRGSLRRRWLLLRSSMTWGRLRRRRLLVPVRWLTCSSGCVSLLLLMLGGMV